MVEAEDDEILVAKDVTASQSTLPPPSSMHALISTMYEKMQIMFERLGTIDIEMYQLNKKIGRMSRKAFKIKDLIPSDVDDDEHVEDLSLDDDVNDGDEDDLSSNDLDSADAEDSNA